MPDSPLPPAVLALIRERNEAWTLVAAKDDRSVLLAEVDRQASEIARLREELAQADAVLKEAAENGWQA